MTERCDTCEYWRKRFIDTGIYGYCLRFPNKLDKQCDDWCGEYHLNER